MKFGVVIFPGSTDAIAGKCNQNRNVFGIKHHPERAAEDVLGGNAGKLLFRSLIDSQISVTV